MYIMLKKICHLSPSSGAAHSGATSVCSAQAQRQLEVMLLQPPREVSGLVTALALKSFWWHPAHKQLRL